MEMTRIRAIEFLRRHQPMGSDDVLGQTELDELDRVRRFFSSHPDNEGVELLLGVFGAGDGFGVYQHIEDAVAAHDPATVIPVLKSKLENGPRSVRYWCAQIAANYSDERLVPPLVMALTPRDYDLRYAAVTALESVGSAEALAALRHWLPHEDDEELREVIEEICGGS